MPPVIVILVVVRLLGAIVSLNVAVMAAVLIGISISPVAGFVLDTVGGVLLMHLY